MPFRVGQAIMVKVVRHPDQLFITTDLGYLASQGAMFKQCGWTAEAGFVAYCGSDCMPLWSTDSVAAVEAFNRLFR